MTFASSKTVQHATQPTKQLLENCEPVAWPTGSCNLTSLGYFCRIMRIRLAKQIKSTIDTFEENIPRGIAGIQ